MNKYEVGKIFEPGHFYSPIPDLKEIKVRKSSIFRKRADEEVLGINLNKEKQMNHLEIIRAYINSFNFPLDSVEDGKFYFKNKIFSGLDALAYFSFILQYTPSKIIEIGAGFSSLLAMEVNHRFFNNNIQIQLIEPYPSQNLIKGIENFKNAKLILKPVQDLDLSIFQTLQKNDILFIDSTHVAKIGSDVNYIFFEILPKINTEVLIHFHDIFIPDEYPPKWVFEENRAWNEMYILKAFLMFNNNFQTVFSSYYVFTRFLDKVLDIFGKPIGGGLTG